MPYHVVVEKNNNNVIPLYRAGDDKYTTWKSRAAKHTMTEDGVKGAREWAHKRGWKIRATKNPYPFIILDDDTKMVKPELAHKINKLGEKMKRFVWMGEGWRTHAQQQAFWDAYVRRNYAPPTVAYPGTSNHETGWAGDISLFMHGPKSGYINVGHVQRARKIMRKLNLCLPVPGEAWHTQIGSNWQA